MSKETDTMTNARICTAITARPHHRARRAALTAGLLAVAVLCLAPGIAAAAQTRELIRQFGSMSNPLGSAIDQSNGDLYVADTGNNRVEKFDSNGNFLLAFGADVGGSGVNTCTSGCQPGTSGSAPGQFTNARFVAVDNDPASASYRDVYVGDPGDGLVSKFDSSGNLISSWGTGGQLSGFGSGSGSIAGVAVDAGGNLVVLTGFSSTKYVFSQSGAPVSQTALPGGTPIPYGIAVDAAGDLFEINGADSVEKFTSAGTDLGQVTTTGSTGAIAIDPATGDLYVVTSRSIDHYAFDGSGNVIEPGGSTCTPAAVSGCAPSDSTPFAFAAPKGGGLAVNSVTGDTYATQPQYGQIWEYSALLTVPDVSTGSASNISSTSATVSGTVNPDGVALTDCHFDYGTDTSYGQSVPCQDAGGNSLIGNSSTTPVTVHADLAGLESGIAYHFRLVAGNANGSVQGQDAAFGSASAGFGFKSVSFSVTDQAGNPYTQAGGHPYALTADVHFNTQVDQNLRTEPAENAKDLRVDLPPGLLANPTAVPRCSQSDFLNQSGFPEATNCPADTQIGVVTFEYVNNGAVTSVGDYPVYNLVAPSGEPAQFGFQLLKFAEYIHGAVRTGGDYGLSSNTVVTEALPVVSATLTLWGNPADPSHDSDRACPGYQPPSLSGVNCTSSAPQTPLLTMPTSCPGTQLTATVKADSWENPGSFVTASASSPATTGCGSLQFHPTISVQPDTSQADSPSGVAVDLKEPQDGLTDPTGLASADLKNADVTLPQGMSVDPSAANGLAACTPAQIGMDNASQPSCPDASKVGSVEVDSPLLPDPLTGGIYIAQQDNNPFNSLLAIYVTAQADGALVKLAGHVVADPVTGQLETVFDNNPQLPFSEFKLTFWGGPRGVLATPESCGTYSTTSDLSPWSGGQDAVSSDPFTIGSGCVSGFSPSFVAGTENPQAGAFTPLVMSFSRSDTDQNLSGLTVKLPPGLVAKLAGVSLCTDSELAAAAARTGAQEQASPSCPANSQVGTVTTGAGVGPDPFFLSGKAYLTGPYKGAPYGLAVVVPALAGPYDLGTVVVRQALHIDPTTAQVTAVSDPFPTILKGIPLRLRRVDVNLNRPDFIVNPTSCDVMQIGGTLSSTLAISDPVSSRFQVGGCASLPFSPKLKMQLTGKGQTKSGKHPNLISTLTQHSGQANIHNVRVGLPLSLALDPNNSSHVCPYSVAQAVTTGPANCPASTIVGHATAITPLLSQPLSGPVYLVQGIRVSHGVQIHTLPSLLIPLRGQIALDLRAQTSVSHGKLVTTFPTIPDAPVSKFTLTINGGRKGILVITGRGRSICGKPQVTQANLIAQNGKAEYPNIKMGTPCRVVHHKKNRRKHTHRKHSVRRHRG